MDTGLWQFTVYVLDTLSLLPCTCITWTPACAGVTDY
jgi:hypothetical protein